MGWKTLTVGWIWRWSGMFLPSSMECSCPPHSVASGRQETPLEYWGEWTGVLQQERGINKHAPNLPLAEYHLWIQSMFASIDQHMQERFYWSPLNREKPRIGSAFESDDRWSLKYFCCWGPSTKHYSVDQPVKDLYSLSRACLSLYYISV